MVILVKIQLATILIPLILAEILEWWEPCSNSPGTELCKCGLNGTSRVKSIEYENFDGDDLSTAIRILSNQSICRFSIVDSKVDDISDESFRNLKVEVLSIRNSVVGNFSLFDGLRSMQQVLRRVIITNVSVQHWIFDWGEQFRVLRVLNISSCPDEEWNAASIISSLPYVVRQIVINKCTVKPTVDFWFERFENLEKLNLSNTLLESMNRKILPHPAYNLTSIDLSYNPITSLPEDMFSSMPALTEISLKGTLLTHLRYETFKPLLQQQIALEAEGILLSCDCETTWLHSMKLAWSISNAVCDQPPSLKNRQITSILPIDVCMNCAALQRE